MISPGYSPGIGTFTVTTVRPGPEFVKFLGGYLDSLTEEQRREWSIRNTQGSGAAYAAAMAGWTQVVFQ